VHPFERPRILVVNDDHASLLALTSLLDLWAEELNYTVVSARSGHEALRQVLLHDFAVILLDVNMPGMNGFETAEAIQQHPRAAEIPIIFITAYQADEVARLQAYQRGAADFIFTPVIPQIMRAKVSVFVTMAQKNEELRRQTTELCRHTQELVDINERLTREMEERHAVERASHAKDEFLAMLGHELRNPLSAISSAASLLGMPAITGEIALRARNIVQRQTKQLSAIVDDLLDLSRAMSGKVVLARRPLDLGKLVETCLATYRATGRAGLHTLRDELDAVWVDGDPARLEQVMSNLVENALKYTPPGGAIEVSVKRIGSEAVVVVKDNGIGIAADLLPRVFDIFMQVSSALDRSQGGLGIGLSLVRRMVELHGGAIAVSSEGSGQGSTFTVRLPAIEPVETVRVERRASPRAAKPSILLIDDNDDGREMMALALRAQGYDVRQAGDGIRGIEEALANPPQVALVDIGLPGMDGYEVARRLRRDPATKGIRLVALTGYGLVKDQNRALEAGFDLHLVKPVSTERLSGIIDELA
jgi:signal transduction histidine kinase